MRKDENESMSPPGSTPESHPEPGRARLAPNSMTARTFLAFLASAGLFYVNIMPVLVAGLIEGLGFTNQEAGFVGSANLYGAALGAVSAIFLVKHIPWRKTSYGLLLVLIVIEFLSMKITSADALITTRFIHGLVGGVLVGIGFAVIARTAKADITFGLLLLVQFGLGGFGLMFLPPLVPEYGTSVMFWSLIAFDVVTLLMLPFLGEYPVKPEPAKQPSKDQRGNANLRPMILTLLGIFLFQASNMGPYAFMVGLGMHSGLSVEFTSMTLGAAAWIAIAGAFLVVVMATRFGRTLPVVTAIVLTSICTLSLLFSEISWIYLVANCIIGVTWAFVLPYLFGICSEFDGTGQIAAAGGFASKMGLASGPMIAGLVIGQDNYNLVLWIAAATLIVCMLFALHPARLLDRRNNA
jgi:predicted MFS family arabinose efflux permease